MTIASIARRTRPSPPPFDGTPFVPSPELGDWAMATFVRAGASLENPDHQHLADVSIGFLWSWVANVRAGRRILGECEMMPPQAFGAWRRARAAWQVEHWFGFMPDFLITIAAEHALVADDWSFCALVEHELYHIAQATDEFGAPRFSRETGRPILALRGHDIEEFVGVVARYGADATGVRPLVEAANRGASVGGAQIAVACGTCAGRRAA